MSVESAIDCGAPMGGWNRSRSGRKTSRISHLLAAFTSTSTNFSKTTTLFRKEREGASPHWRWHGSGASRFQRRLNVNWKMENGKWKINKWAKNSKLIRNRMTKLILEPVPNALQQESALDLTFAQPHHLTPSQWNGSERTSKQHCLLIFWAKFIVNWMFPAPNETSMKLLRNLRFITRQNDWDSKRETPCRWSDHLRSHFRFALQLTLEWREKLTRHHLNRFIHAIVASSAAFRIIKSTPVDCGWKIFPATVSMRFAWPSNLQAVCNSAFLEFHTWLHFNVRFWFCFWLQWVLYPHSLRMLNTQHTYRHARIS